MLVKVSIFSKTDSSYPPLFVSCLFHRNRKKKCYFETIRPRFRFNYKVNEVFRELMGCTGGIGGYNLAGMNFSQAHDKDKCTIL